MPKPKTRTTFSIRALLCFVTLAGIVTFYFTFERTASLKLPATSAGQLDEAKLRALKSDSILERVVGGTQQSMLPRPLRGETPNYAWLKQAMSIRPNSETNEIDVEISSNLATSEQLKQLIEALSKYRVETHMPTMPSRLDRFANWISGTKESVQDRAASELLRMKDAIMESTTSPCE